MKVYQRMKITKKWLAVLLTAALTVAMSLPVYTTDGTGNGSITIDNAVAGQTYSVYRIFDLDSYNKDEGAYLYKVNAAWKGFISQTSISGTDGYVTVDDVTELVTWKKTDVNGDPIGVAEFARLALEYAKDENHLIDFVKSEEAKSTTITFSPLPLGYYLVDSSLGALCALDTTNPDVTMREKNGEPTVDKKVQEDGNYGETAKAQIGDTVTFQTTITAQAGAEKYVLHDRMSQGLEFAGITSVVKNPGDAQTTLTETNGDYTFTSPGPESTPCSFELAFSEDVCKGLAAGDKIVVTYTAVLTKDAAIGGTNPNTNDTWLKYGDETMTRPVQAKVYTYQFQLVKTDEGKNGTYNVLTGAQFKLYDTAAGSTAIKFEKNTTDNSYVVVPASTTGAAVTEVIEAGTPIIKGLDAKKYWLEEIKAPDGFNKQENRFKVEITGDNLVGAGVLTGNNPGEYKPIAGGVQVINKAGGMLPSTGGIGTTIFYVLGGILVLSAAVMLVIRYRRGEEK